MVEVGTSKKIQESLKTALESGEDVETRQKNFEYVFNSFGDLYQELKDSGDQEDQEAARTILYEMQGKLSETLANQVQTGEKLVIKDELKEPIEFTVDALGAELANLMREKGDIFMDWIKSQDKEVQKDPLSMTEEDWKEFMDKVQEELIEIRGRMEGYKEPEREEEIDFEPIDPVKPTPLKPEEPPVIDKPITPPEPPTPPVPEEEDDFDTYTAKDIPPPKPPKKPTKRPTKPTPPIPEDTPDDDFEFDPVPVPEKEPPKIELLKMPEIKREGNYIAHPGEFKMFDTSTSANRRTGLEELAENLTDEMQFGEEYFFPETDGVTTMFATELLATTKFSHRVHKKEQVFGQKAPEKKLTDPLLKGAGIEAQIVGHENVLGQMITLLQRGGVENSEDITRKMAGVIKETAIKLEEIIANSKEDEFSTIKKLQSGSEKITEEEFIHLKDEQKLMWDKLNQEMVQGKKGKEVPFMDEIMDKIMALRSQMTIPELKKKTGVARMTEDSETGLLNMAEFGGDVKTQVLMEGFSDAKTKVQEGERRKASTMLELFNSQAYQKHIEEDRSDDMDELEIWA